MFKPVEVKALPDYQIWIRYADGTEGAVDVSHLAGRGVFTLWDDYAAFEQVYIGEAGQIAWSGEMDLCPDTVYMDLRGLTWEEAFGRQTGATADA